MPSPRSVSPGPGHTVQRSGQQTGQEIGGGEGMCRTVWDEGQRLVTWKAWSVLASEVKRFRRDGISS